ncbi:MAG: T9SS type A sorting domain-containing protein [Bacteroidota bacterium]
MKKALLLFTILCTYMASGQVPIFNPGMTITSFGIVDSPVGEEVDKIIDGDINTKFLDFELDDGMAFTVDLGGTAKVATSLEMTTGNDFEVRDPIGYEIFGSNDGSSFTTVATGDIPCIVDRLFTRTFDFTNTEAYSFYRINYTVACDPSGGTGIPSIQVSETQLYEIELGTNDTPLDHAISLYPNPNNGVFTLNYTGNEQLLSAVVMDFSGKILQEIELRSVSGPQKVLLEPTSSGLYFVQIRTEYAVATKRILLK